VEAFRHANPRIRVLASFSLQRFKRLANRNPTEHE
jgi:hypothetical protein